MAVSERKTGESTAEELSGSPGDHSGRGEKQPSVAVVVPTYNEAENLPELVSLLFSLDIPNSRLIVVDDGSPDGTGEVARKLAAEHDGRLQLLQRGSKQGLGTAYVLGFSQALSDGADYVLQMDADLSHELKYVPEFLKGLKDADVVVGSRYVPGGGVDETWSLFRKLLSYGSNLGIRMVTGLKVKDATSGFKAFRGGVLRSLDLDQFRSTGFAFQVEMAYACQRRRYRISEFPIVFASRSRGRSKMSMAIGLEAAWRLLLLRWNRRWNRRL